MKKLISSHSLNDIEGPIDSVIEKFKSEKERFESMGYKDISVEFETEYGYYDDVWIQVYYYGVKTRD